VVEVAIALRPLGIVGKCGAALVIEEAQEVVTPRDGQAQDGDGGIIRGHRLLAF
jgi:hypothetical protein